MKRGLWILLAAITAGVAGFLAMRLLPSRDAAPADHPHEENSALPELEWLRREFSLDDAEFERVSRLHLAYLPTCEDLCAKISRARTRVRNLILAGTSVTPELDAALREEAALRAECQSAMLAHLYETAATLPPEKSRSYLDAMLPEVLSMTSDPAAHHEGKGHPGH